MIQENHDPSQTKEIPVVEDTKKSSCLLLGLLVVDGQKLNLTRIDNVG